MTYKLPPGCVCTCKICRQIRRNFKTKEKNNLKDRIKELEIQVKKLKSNWCSIVDCELRKTIRELEKENGQLKEQLLYFVGSTDVHNSTDSRGDYWYAVVANCRKLMPKGSNGICLDTFIRSILNENKLLKEEIAIRTDVVRQLKEEIKGLKREIEQCKVEHDIVCKTLLRMI